MKKLITAILVSNIILGAIPSLVSAQEIPQTMQEAEGFGAKMLNLLPGTIKNIWQNQALPVWQNMWNWTQGSKAQNLWGKIWSITGQKTPDVKEEFQKEKQEMQKDLWQRFKDLF